METVRNKRKYGRAWKRIRDKYIKNHPICENCMKATATEVHHIVPISDGGMLLKDNLMTVCAECHKNIHEKMKKEQSENGN